MTMLHYLLFILFILPFCLKIFSPIRTRAPTPVLDSTRWSLLPCPGLAELSTGHRADSLADLGNGTVTASPATSPSMPRPPRPSSNLGPTPFVPEAAGNPPVLIPQTVGFSGTSKNPKPRGFTKSGAESLDLSLGQQNANSLRSTLGGRIAYTWNLNQKIALIPEVRMFWQHEFLKTARNISASLDDGSGAAFGYETTDPYRDSVFAGAGVTAQFGKNLSG
jgi:hypothetical protein